MDDELLFGGMVFVAALVVWVTYSWHESTQWDAFSASHHCVKVGEMDGEYIIGFGKGNNGSYVPGKNGWKCDDGVTYWRSK